MRKVIIVLSLLAMQGFAFAQSIMYVTQQGAGARDGSSWANASNSLSLQTAINNLAANGGGQVWIASGTYYPSEDTTGNSNPTDARSKTFTLRNKVAVYGGFAGTETSINARSKSDKNADKKISAWEFLNETILSGNINNDADSSNNAYHVVYQKANNVDGILLDGVTVQEGFAVKSIGNPQYEEDNGGGLFVNNVNVVRCTIKNNIAYNYAGGVYLHRGSIDSCFIAQNSFIPLSVNWGDGFGGGVAINEIGTISNSLIWNNSGHNGSGIFCNAGGIVTSCVISFNKNGLCAYANRGAVIMNSIFVNNDYSVNFTEATVVSCTIAKNKQNAYFWNSSILNTIVADVIAAFGSNQDIKYSMVMNIPKDSATNIVLKNFTDFGFVDTIDFKLKGTSPAINAGMPNVGSLNQVSTDLFGNQRISYDIIDIGSYEYSSRRYVSTTGSGDSSGTSWDNALPGSSLIYATDLGAGEVWIKQGTYFINSKENPSNGITLSGNEKVYGGFAGTETNINQRVKADIDNNNIVEAWEFATPTILKSDPLAASSSSMPEDEGLPYLVDCWGENKNTLLDGVTIRDFQQEETAQYIDGGAIRLGAGTITNCILTNNSTYPADEYNSVVSLYGSAQINHCLITNNKSKYGGGLGLEGLSTASFCVIRNNTSFGGGGGVSMSGNSILENATVCNNKNIGAPSDNNGGGVLLSGGTVKNCVITNNTTTGTATRGGGVFVQESTIDTIQNSIIVNNSAIGSDADGQDIGIAQAVTMVNTIIGSPMFLRAIRPSNIITHCVMPDSIKSFGIENNYILANQTLVNALFKKPSQFKGNGFSADSTQAIVSTDWHLNTSQYFNKGLVSTAMNYSNIDADGNQRIEHDTIDIGPYELKIAKPSIGNRLAVVSQPSPGIVQMAWKNTDSDRYLLFVNENISGSGSVELTNGLNYTSNNRYGLGENSNNWYCIYNGTDTTVTITGLLQGTNYKAMLITANGSSYLVYNDTAVDNVTINTFITKREQTILLNLPDTIRGATEFVANVSTTSGLGVALSSSVPSIASVLGTKITTLKEGITVITATQEGNSLFFPATATVSFVVKKDSQQIIGFNAFPLKKVGSSTFKILASSSSGLPITYKSSNPAVAEVIENEVTINASGVCVITAIVNESDVYLGVSQSQTLIVSAVNNLKMPLYIIDRDTTINLSDLIVSNDTFTFQFVSGKTTKATVNGTMAIITVNATNKAWIGTDTLWFTATNENIAGDVQTLGIKIRRRPLVEEIGLVTVDSSTSTRCIIAWNRSRNAGIKGYILYRGGNTAGIWDSIGYVPVTERSLFVDSNVNVKKQAFQYRMVTVDSNDVYSSSSKVHTTMHLLTGVNLQNQPQLWWSPYGGTDVDSYIIYRKDIKTGTLDSIGSSILTSFTDIDAAVGSVNYRVGIRFALQIDPSELKADSGPFSQSLSNMAESELTAIGITDDIETISVSPNPTNQFVTITIPQQQAFSVIFIDMMGREIQSESGNGSIKLDCSLYAKGLYYVKILLKDRSSIRPLLIE
jgi:hypothetical protein